MGHKGGAETYELDWYLEKTSLTLLSGDYPVKFTISGPRNVRAFTKQQNLQSLCLHCTRLCNHRPYILVHNHPARGFLLSQKSSILLSQNMLKTKQNEVTTRTKQQQQYGKQLRIGTLPVTWEDTNTILLEMGWRWVLGPGPPFSHRWSSCYSLANLHGHYEFFIFISYNLSK